MKIKNLNKNKVESVPEFIANVFAEKRSKYCLLIPLFNEGNRYLNQVKKMQKNGIFEKVDIIICDAGSTDGTTDPEYLEKTGHRVLLTRKGNGRYSTDMRMGYYWALEEGYEGVISVDGNDKDSTEAVDLFIQKLDEGYDYIQGSRFIKGGKEINTPISRYIAMKLINEPIMSFCAGKHLSDTTNGFRAYSKRFLKDENVLPFRDIFYGYEIIYYLPIRACRMGFNVCEIPVTRAYPKGEVPSKVGGIRGNIYQMSILYHCIFKHYNPDSTYKFKKSYN